MRIGIISDTHVPLNAKELPKQLIKVFADVELILHAGDIYLASVLDELDEMAPVLAAYGDGDERMRTKIAADVRIEKRHAINIDGLCIGLGCQLRYGLA